MPLQISAMLIGTVSWEVSRGFRQYTYLDWYLLRLASTKL
jgi:hypothetical protein